MNIVIPTYLPHLQYNIKFIESFEQYCLDKNDVNIYFVIDDEQFLYYTQTRVNEYNIIKLSSLLKLAEIENYRYTNKYVHQSLKKYCHRLF